MSEVVVRPLLPAGQWSYFAIDALPYHGHLLTVIVGCDREAIWQGQRDDVDGRWQDGG